jgi:hypothetical protein
MTDFALLVAHHLQLASITYDRGELISFLETNRVLVDREPDAGWWAIQFAAHVREQAAAAVVWH